MRVLIIGGTGLISTGIVKHLLVRGADVTMFNRGQRAAASGAPSGNIRQIHGDRDDVAAYERRWTDERFDVVIDMICYRPEQAESDIRAFAGRCEHFLFCSTVCTYGTRIPAHVLVDERFPQEPISAYGRGKLACERAFLQAHEQGKLKVTIVRPSHTYGPGNPLIDNLEFNSLAWDRIEKGLPVLCAGDGLGLWQSTHRDDCGKLFAYAALNSKTYGQAYNATIDRVFTWRDYHREVGEALGRPAKLLFMPAGWIVRHDPQRFGLLKEITQFHGPYTSAKAKADVPEFRCDIDFRSGVSETLTEYRRLGKWRTGDDDPLYQSLVEHALAAGVEPVEA